MTWDFNSGGSLSVSAPFTAAPVTVAAWCTTSSNVAVFKTLVGCGDTAATNNYFSLGHDNSGVSRWWVRNGGPSSTATGATLSANTRYHLVGMDASTSDHRVYVNGTRGTDDTNARVPAGVDTFYVGGNASGGSSPVNLWSDGFVSHVTIWNVGLTDGEVASLAGGLHPLLMRPGSIIAHWEMSALGSTERDLVGANTLTNSGCAAVKGSLVPLARPGPYAIYPAVVAAGASVGTGLITGLKLQRRSLVQSGLPYSFPGS